MGTDICSTHVCAPNGDCILSLTNCDDANDCTLDTCDVAKGGKDHCSTGLPPISCLIGCQHTPQDCLCSCPIASDKCVLRTCSQGICINTTRCAPEDSPDVCHIFTGNCDLTTGCESTLTCDDNDPCTIDVCDGSNGTAICTYEAKCLSPDPCQISSCDSQTGNCSEVPKSCQTDICASQTCFAGECVGQNISCDDLNDCTFDYCDANLGGPLSHLFSPPNTAFSRLSTHPSRLRLCLPLPIQPLY